MKIRDILRTKGSDVLTIAEDRSVLEAVRTLVEHNVGSLVVMRGERLAGILTERDILRLTAHHGSLGGLDVGSSMTTQVVTSTPDDELQHTMGVMTNRRIRHLPVVEGERLVGIVSIGDLLNAARTVAERENSQLREYIQGAG